MLETAAPGADEVPLLGELKKLASERLVAALDRSLARVDDYLFDRSEVGSHAIESLNALRELRRARGGMLQRFQTEIGNGFQQLCGRKVPVQEFGELALLDDEGLEEQLANTHLADALVRQHQAAVGLLNHRIGYLLQGSPLNQADNPLAPEAIARIAGAAFRDAPLAATQRIVLYKYLERELSGTLGDLYARCNALLAASGVPGVGQNPGGDARVAHAAADSVAGIDPGAGAALDDRALFANLLPLLHAWRGSPATPLPGHGAGAGSGTLETSELLAVLGRMQHDLPARLLHAGGTGPEQEPAGADTLVARLRQALFDGAGQLGIGGQRRRLGALDEDAVDLVALMFDTFLEDWNFDAKAREVIGRLLVPLAKVAVRERDLFLHKQHPARRFLNTIAEACEGNRGDGPLERELLQQVTSVIERLVAEFNEDIAIFETLEQELRDYLTQYRRRVEVIEKRTAEAQQGRERLQVARQAAQTRLAATTSGQRPPQALTQFIEQYGVHHLTTVHLREGEESARYRLAVEAIQYLVERCAPGTHDGDIAGNLREAMLDIFASSGLTGNDSARALTLLLEVIDRHAGHAVDETVLDEVRLPEQPLRDAAADEPEPVSYLEVVGGSATLDYDDDTFARVQALQVGDWITLHDAAGEPYPAKASWISPISARLLFVNRRGIRVLVASRHELAAMAKLGSMRFRERAPAFDVAMRRVAERIADSAKAANESAHY